MKRIKVFENGKRLKDIYPYATKWEVFKYNTVKRIKWCIKWCLIGGIVWLICIFYSALHPAVIITEAEVIREVEVRASVLDRIAGCESMGNPKSKGVHYDKNGQVLMRSNTNKSVDVGKYQINTVWFAKATELGLDITKEQDNEAMALWIYKNRGTGDWSASAKCWR